MYYSHSKKDESGNNFGSKELKVHTKGVLRNALLHYSSNLDLGFTDGELQELLQIIVEFHDLGKYTSYFQNYLLDKEPIRSDLKRHAQIGGLAAYNLLEEKDAKKALLALYIIFMHHSQLVDMLEIGNKLDENLGEIIEKQQDDLQAVIERIETDLNRKEMKGIIRYPEQSGIIKARKGFRRLAKKDPSIQNYFLINYLFSLLIEADKLDASDTEPYTLKVIDPSHVDTRFGKPAKKVNELSSMSNNELRNHCRKVVVSHLSDENILDEFIFTLTAPTGIGKTMTALDFALKLKSKVRESLGIESRIIYALPFINIIEQALAEYKITLPDDITVLGHYQYADVFGKEDKPDADAGEESNYNQKLMALDTWQADVVITSFVQFFETLIGNRNKLLKKFNHFANAIIILDEVQTLRLEHMPLLGAVLYYLSKFLKSRIILMTATRPKIFELAEQIILNEVNEEVKPRELLTGYENVFSVFDRTSIHPLLDVLIENKDKRVEEFVEQIFSNKWSENKSCLIVCNTVNISIELYEAIVSFLENNGYTNRTYYLSTNIVPVARFEIIKRLKSDLDSKMAPILVSTQVVEAGVDLDFDMGFRDIGPVDSIIQVAGRINRNNDPKRKSSPLYVVDFHETATTNVYGRMSYTQARDSLRVKPVFREQEYLQLINGYFDGVSKRKSFRDSKQWYASMKSLKYYSDDPKMDFPVSSFQIIEETDRYRPVFIEIDDEATQARESYLMKIENELSKEEFDKNWKLKFQQRIVLIPKYLCDGLDKINEYEENILCVSKEEVDSRYHPLTGFIRKVEQGSYIHVL